MVTVMAAIEWSLAAQGHTVALGSGVGAVQRALAGRT